MADREVIKALTSRLLNLGELGELADLVIEFRANRSGGTHAPSCHNLRKQATEPQMLTVAEYRASEPELHACALCGGGAPTTLTDSQAQLTDALVGLWKTKQAEEREKAVAARLAGEEKRQADAIDERAAGIVMGWEWEIDRELTAAIGYPEEAVSAVAACCDCDAAATIIFVPRTLSVTFRCPRDADHGFRRRSDGSGTAPVWPFGERDYVARAMVAPVLAGQDACWHRAYGSRAEDYRTTGGALAAFDAANPEPMRLTPDVRCGECGTRMTPYPGYDLGQGHQVEAGYGCQVRHEDGKFGRRERRDVDETIDQILTRTLSGHPSWAAAPELEPTPELLARYADYLTARAAVYDERIGAASGDRELSQTRAEIGEALVVVAAMQEHGALRAAGVEGPRHWGPWSTINPDPFSNLGRALLTERVEVSKKRITVVTRFDEGAPLYRTLRAREIREELAGLRHREAELTEELAQLDAAN
jgi:hypothetical protein